MYLCALFYIYLALVITKVYLSFFKSIKQHTIWWKTLKLIYLGHIVPSYTNTSHKVPDWQFQAHHCGMLLPESFHRAQSKVECIQDWRESQAVSPFSAWTSIWKSSMFIYKAALTFLLSSLRGKDITKPSPVIRQTTCRWLGSPKTAFPLACLMDWTV